ncbi:unnamed protein product [Cunninghamella echinulata]
MESIRKWVYNDTTPSSELYAKEEDCLTCTSPCEEHPSYPSYLQIKTDRTIASTVKPYERHILISTGKKDWPKKIEDDQDSIAKALLSTRPNRSTMISSSSILTIHSNMPDAQDLIILPDNIIIANVTSNNVDQLWSFLEYNNNKNSSSSSTATSKEYDSLIIIPSPYSALILICSHGRRDKRCGVTAPILGREFDRILRNKDDSDDIEIIYVSHIGGHKIAGNVICYTHQSTRGIWYGLVKPCHVEAIVEQTIENGKIIHSLFRGCMANSFNDHPSATKKSLFSW